MGVGADDERHTPVDEMSHRHFFARCLTVEIEQDDIGVAAQPPGRQHFGDRRERIVERVHKQPCHQVENDDAPTARIPEFRDTTPRRALGEIIGPQNSRFLVEMRNDIALVPHMIAGGDDIDPRRVELVADFRRDAEPASRVFAVHDDEIYVVAFAQPGHVTGNRLAPGPADDIAANHHTH